MKRIIYSFAILFIVGLSSASVHAQSRGMGSEYKTALGVKFYPGSVTLKHFVKDNAAVEGLLNFWRYGMRITGLYEFHDDIRNAPGLKWYAGPGAHIGFWNKKGNNYYGSNGGAYLGIDGVLGLDYKIKNAPINLSIDWQPSFTFGDYNGFDGGWGGFAIRFTL